MKRHAGQLEQQLQPAAAADEHTKRHCRLASARAVEAAMVPECSSGCSEAADCSSTIQPASDGGGGDPPQQLCGAQQQLSSRHRGDAVLEGMLQRALADADAALQLTSSAMGLATSVVAGGAPDAADAALLIAESALATTIQQLAVAQALVARKAQAHGVPTPWLQQQQQRQQQGWARQPQEPEELQDTCSSAPAAQRCSESA